jgi:hypothetical protein
MNGRSLVVGVLCALFVLGAGESGEAGLRREEISFTKELDVVESVLEGTVVDNETGEPVLNAVVRGEFGPARVEVPVQRVWVENGYWGEWRRVGYRVLEVDEESYESWPLGWVEHGENSASRYGKCVVVEGGEMRRYVSEVRYGREWVDNSRWEGGHFRLIGLGRVDRPYELWVSAPGYEPLRLVGTVRAGEHRELGEVGLRYHPFDLELSKTSGSLSRYEGESWGSKRLTVTVTPRNGYDDLVRLDADADGITASFGSRELRFNSPASTTLTLRPVDSLTGGTFEVVVEARDVGGRLVETATYHLILRTDQPPSSAGAGSGTASTGSRSGGSGGSGSASKRVSRIEKFYVKVWDSWGGLEGATVWVKVRRGEIYEDLRGTTDSSGRVEWSARNLYCQGTLVDVYASKPGYYVYDWLNRPYDRVWRRGLYIGTGAEYGTTLYLTNIGRITGLVAAKDKLEFEYEDYMNDDRILSTTLTVRGDYTRRIGTSYNSGYGAAYKVWTSPGSVTMAEPTYTFTAQCLKWQPPTGIMFHPGVGNIGSDGMVARVDSWGPGLTRTFASTIVTVCQKPVKG